MESRPLGASDTVQKLTMAALTMMVFSGALLLFGIEPLAGKFLTPYFGSAAHVWLTCLMFFQGMLFIGYLYAHYIARKIGPWHLMVLLLPLVNLPLKVDATPDSSAPLINILLTLLSHIALPFTVLSTTAVVAQYWLSCSRAGRELNPYPLYAASNAGSLVALLGYTLLVEPLMGLRAQSMLWTAGYFTYGVIVIAVWVMLGKDKVLTTDNNINQKISHDPIAASTYIKWLLLSIIPSALLLAVTNLITLEVGSFPLIWIAPLALYLTSFIVTFRNNGGVPKYLKVIWPQILLGSLVFYLIGLSTVLTIIGHLLLFFCVCLIANGTLYDLRPPATRLTTFYLTSALGGWIGGVLVSLIAPFAFTGLYEYPITILVLGIVLGFCHPSVFKNFSPRAPLPVSCAHLLGTTILLACAGVGVTANFLNNDTRFRHRNFYGTYNIRNVKQANDAPSGMRILAHGKTLHGAQFNEQGWRLKPITYYYDGGAISQVYDTKTSPRNMAILGLGAGVAASYANASDTISYYEIDPDNEMIARRWFSFLEECKGQVRVIVGDGRLAMQKGASERIKYDIIHVDAFTGDSIPSHLLTEEAIMVYLSRLTDDGLILLHISNRYYDLRPVIKATAQEMNLFAATNVIVGKKHLKSYQISPRCIVLAKNVKSLAPLLGNGWLMLNNHDESNDVRPWTDDYVNMLDPLLENMRSLKF